MIRIGAVDIDTSHPKRFAKCFEKSKKAKYAAVYNEGFRADDEVEGFMNMFGVEKKCATIHELVDSVDIGFIHSCNWDKHVRLAEPFIDAGKPVFVDKPLCGNLGDCGFFEEAAGKGAAILGSSSVRYAEEIEQFVAEQDSAFLNTFGTCGVDEFNYGVHIVEALGGLFGEGAVSTRFCGEAARDGKICRTFLVRYGAGATAVYNNFIGTWQPFDMTIMTADGTYNFRIDTDKIYDALIDRILDYMETGENRLAPVTALTESVKIMLAGKISFEQEGAEISLDSIPGDYSGFDGDAFEREYSKNAKKLYLG